MSLLFRVLSLCVTLNVLVGCGLVYRPDLAQGNYIDAQQVAQLKLGMTRDQVIFILGSPMFQDAFDQQTLHYISRIDSRKDGVNQRSLKLTFKNGHLVDIQGADLFH